MDNRLLVTGLGKQRIILGFPWLTEHNPDINWQTGQFTWRMEERPRRFLNLRRKKKEISPEDLKLHLLKLAKKLARVAITEEVDREAHLNRTQNPALENDEIPTPDNDVLLAFIQEMIEQDEIWIQTKTSNSIEFHLMHDEKKENIPLTEQIPKEYHEYLDVFDENKADRFPDPRPWDHKIELKEGFQPKAFKSYNLTPEEQIELDKFLTDNKDKGYIQLSQSPMATPFFFVKKKDGKL